MRRFCGFVTGFVFFISGVLKLIDPVGAGLVMEEYFSFLHIGFMDFAAKPAGVLLAFAESVIGTAMITGIWRKASAVASLSFQGFFTLLTLLLVIFNPQMDCGCFGEAIHLTHMQTFIKNIVLLTLLILAYVPMRNLGGPKRRKYVSFSLVTISLMVFTIYSWAYIPMVDFTDFKPESILAASRSNINEEDMYEAVFVYEKDGQKKAFTLEHLPDSTWTFVSTETIMKDEFRKEGVSLSFYDPEGAYHDEEAAEGKVLVISVYEPDKMKRRWSETARRIIYAEKAGFHTILLTAAAPEKMQDIMSGLSPEERETISNHMYFSDFKTLVTLNRSNGGVTFFNEGTLIAKWAYRAFPDNEKLEELYHENPMESSINNKNKGSLSFQGFLLYTFAVMLLL